MKTKRFRGVISLLLALMMLSAVACGVPKTTGSDGDTAKEDTSRDDSASGSDEASQSKTSQIQQGQSFAEAHDAFQTTLTRQDNDTDSIPEPPEGVFDLVSYPSKVGDLAAYVSSDPGGISVSLL